MIRNGTIVSVNADDNFFLPFGLVPGSRTAERSRRIAAEKQRQRQKLAEDQMSLTRSMTMWPTGTFRNPWGDGSVEKRQKENSGGTDAEKTEETLEEIFRKVRSAKNLFYRHVHQLRVSVSTIQRVWRGYRLRRNVELLQIAADSPRAQRKERSTTFGGYRKSKHLGLTALRDGDSSKDLKDLKEEPSVTLRRPVLNYRTWDAGSVLLRNRAVYVARSLPAKDRFFNPLDGGRPVDRMHPPSPNGSAGLAGNSTPSPSRSEAEAAPRPMLQRQSSVNGARLTGPVGRTKTLVVPTNPGSPSLMQRKLANPASPWDRARGATTAAYQDRREAEEEDDRQSLDLDEVRERLHSRVNKYRTRVKNQRLLSALLTSAYMEAVETIRQPEMNAAAVKVQAGFRGKRGRQATAEARRRRTEEKLEEEKAATKVQSLYRGKMSRQSVALKIEEQKVLAEPKVEEADPDYDDDDDDFEAEDFEDDFEAEAGDGDGSAQGDESSHDGDAEAEQEPEPPEREAPPSTTPGGKDALAAQEAAQRMLPALYESAALVADVTLSRQGTDEVAQEALGRAAAIAENLQGVYGRVVERLASKAMPERHDGTATSFVLLVCQAGILAAAQGDG